MRSRCPTPRVGNLHAAQVAGSVNAMCQWPLVHVFGSGHQSRALSGAGATGTQQHTGAEEAVQASRSSTSKAERELKQRLLLAALENVPSCGWSLEAIERGCAHLGLPPVMHGIFPKGAASLIEEFIIRSNDQLALQLDAADFTEMRVPERIRFAVETRLRMNVPYIAQWPQGLAIMADPAHLPTALKLTAQMVDDMWLYAGDTTDTTDLNYYSKRAILTGVYGATEIFMLQDQSQDYQSTLAFLDRRLLDVAKLGKATAEFKNATPFLKGAFTTLKNIVGAPSQRH